MARHPSTLADDLVIHSSFVRYSSSSLSFLCPVLGDVSKFEDRAFLHPIFRTTSGSGMKSFFVVCAFDIKFTLKEYILLPKDSKIYWGLKHHREQFMKEFLTPNLHRYHMWIPCRRRPSRASYAVNESASTANSTMTCPCLPESLFSKL